MSIYISRPTTLTVPLVIRLWAIVQTFQILATQIFVVDGSVRFALHLRSQMSDFVGEKKNLVNLLSVFVPQTFDHGVDSEAFNKPHQTASVMTISLHNMIPSSTLSGKDPSRQQESKIHDLNSLENFDFTRNSRMRKSLILTQAPNSLHRFLNCIVV